MKFGFRKPRSIAKSVQLLKSNPDEHGHPQNCLNCEAALVGSYCHVCGQSAHTHRMSFKHFLLHDMMHGIWHLDKGFPATLKKAFVNPGKEIRNYLAGKRTGWFSILTMILLLYAVAVYIGDFFETMIHEPIQDSKYKSVDVVIEFVEHHAKWFLLGLSFVCSWSSFLVFRRAKLNLSEHTIINCFFLIGLLCINIVLEPTDSSSAFLTPIPVTCGIYLIYGYYGAFRNLYTGLGFSWRFMVHGLISSVGILLISVAGIATMALVTGEFKSKLNKETEQKTAVPVKTAP